MKFESEIIFTQQELDKWNEMLAFRSDNEKAYESKLNELESNSTGCVFKNSNEIEMALYYNENGIYVHFAIYFPESFVVDGLDTKVSIVDKIIEDDYKIDFTTDDGVETYIVKVRIKN